MTTYEYIAIIIAVSGLVGLRQYVKHTKAIAEATRQQGDILSRPTISVLCGPTGTRHQPFSEVGTKIVNHSMTHANIKVTIKAKLRVNGADHDEVFPALAPYDGTIWPAAARQEYDGHFSFDGLKGRMITDKDTLTLVGTIESSAFRGKGKNVFEENPPIGYIWKHSTKEWVPGPSIPQ